MAIVAFDSGDFTRRKRTADEGKGSKEVVFYTPLGIGAKFNEDEEDEFLKTYHSTCQQITSFVLPTKRYVYSHTPTWMEIGHAKTIKICDTFIQNLQKLIDRVFVSYVVLPPNDVKQVEVGGYGCPMESIKTEEFLRKLSPMFSYITAWAYNGRHMRDKNHFSIDHFSSKLTTAWRDLSSLAGLKIYARGDECNEYISIADMLAYLTEKKLWDAKLWLLPENVQKVWSDYAFDVEPRFIDENLLSKIRWYSQDMIDTTSHLARPVVFLDVEGISISKLSRVRASVAAYACLKKGSFMGYDEHIDPNKIRDGDVYVYAGDQAKQNAMSYKDMFELEVYSVKQIREKVRTLL